jgi:hypothetical protein
VHEKVTNDAYKSEWKRYRKSVDESRAEEKLQPGEKFLTRDNVDFLFFGEKVAYREEVPDSAQIRLGGSLRPCSASQTTESTKWLSLLLIVRT